MKAEKISEIKKELNTLNRDQLVDICLRLAKYKKENKELLSFLLYDAEDPVSYVESVKTLLIEEFHSLRKYDYHSAKQLRKILRLVAKHAKYTASVEAEVILLLWFCHNYLLYADLKTHYKPLHNILIRQVEKLKKLFPKLHEDLQFDYSSEYGQILDEADRNAKWFNKKLFAL
ncbi:hypothetical protein [Desertivirga arenae]|uniref:hypothetical protein n=1 Tax=Desertivirga arenae TaxID=2810309 RepID=UPI001A968765|nr:hypothetical protein [Pedobacter sp. SYSU D00823]